jgi:hypothetical protein
MNITRARHANQYFATWCDRWHEEAGMHATRRHTFAGSPQAVRFTTTRPHQKLTSTMPTKTILKQSLFSLTSICKGEVFAGYLARHRMHGSVSPLVQLYGHGVMSWILPSRLEENVALLSDYVGSVGNVLANHTLIPGFNRFLSLADAERVRTHHVGSTEWRVNSIIGLTNNRQLGHTWSPGICIECLKEDIAPNGATYWRRDFLLSHVRFCARHGKRIYTYCGICNHGFRTSGTLDAPRNSCCSRPLKVRKHVVTHNIEHLELDLARGWSTLLDARFAPHVRGPEIATVIHKKAWELGLLTEQVVRWKRFEEFFGQPDLTALGISVGFPFRSDTTHLALRGQASPRNPFHALFLLVAMFGSWNAAERAILSSQSVGKSKPEAPRVSDPKWANIYQRQRPRFLARSAELLPETTRLYEQLRDANPHLSHSSLVLRLPHANRMGLTVDVLRKGGVKEIPARGPDKAARNDASAAAHIERRWHDLIESGARFRFTAQRLLYGHSLANRWTDPAARDASPKAAAMLAKYSETPVMRSRRILRVDILAGKVPRCRPANVDSLDGMTDREIESLMDHCSYIRRKR